MIHLYIDESGSMTTEHSDKFPYFVISIIKPKDNRTIKTFYKRFVNKNLKDLLEADKNHKMFINNEFKELKGSEFTPDLKKKFIEQICKYNNLEIFYIFLRNKYVDQHFYENTARAFNFSIKIALEYFIKKGLLPKDEYDIQLDERNQKTKTRYFLDEYLNTEFHGNKVMSNNISVTYFDSCNNIIVQIADVFANIFYSHLMTGNYKNEIKQLEITGYLKKIFKFPNKK